jgi:hypothetical protein
VIQSDSTETIRKIRDKSTTPDEIDAMTDGTITYGKVSQVILLKMNDSFEAS